MILHMHASTAVTFSIMLLINSLISLVYYFTDTYSLYHILVVVYCSVVAQYQLVKWQMTIN